MADRPGAGLRSLVRLVLRTAVSWTYDAVYRLTGAVRRGLLSLKSPAVRESLLIAVAYVTGVVGLVLSVVGDPTDPGTGLGAVGIGLMGVSFVCLFVVSVSILRATGGDVADR